MPFVKNFTFKVCSPIGTISLLICYYDINDIVLNILQPNERYKGRSYSEWIEEWSNLLVSSSPDNQTPSEMFFLRGNLDYEADATGSRTLKPGKFLDRTGSLSPTIDSDTALFIPIMTAMYSISDPYEARQLLDEEDLRRAVRTDITEGGNIWLRFKSSNIKTYKPILPKNDNIKNYYSETRMFTLRISSQSPLIEKFETAMGPGEYETVQGGYFVILTDLAPGTYRFHYGGNGRGSYYTDSVFDITVRPDQLRNLVTDLSNRNVFQGPKKDKDLKTYRHLKTEDDIETALPFP